MFNKIIKSIGMACAIMSTLSTFSFASENVICSVCDGKVTELTLQYNGTSEASIKVLAQKGEVIFNDTVIPNDQFTLSGFDTQGTLGTEIKLFINGQENTRIHTSCSVPILSGMHFGEFAIVEGYSRNGGALCQTEEEAEPAPTCAECDGKISTLTLQSNLDRTVLIEVYSHKEELIFKKNVSKYDFFTLNGFDNKGTLGPKVNLYVDGVFDTEIHTSCSVALLIGMEFGSVTIRDGASRNGGTTCSVPGYTSVGHLCGSIYEDKNLNGIQDSDEKSDTNITLTVIDAKGYVHHTSPDENGAYCVYTIPTGEANIVVNTETLPLGTLLMSGENPNSAIVIENTTAGAGTDTYAYAEPDAFDDNLTTDEDIPLNFMLKAEDIINRPLTYIFLTQPQYGKLSGTAPNLIYTPDTNYYGEDSFTFKVNNGILDSEVATIHIDVLPINDPPVAVDDNVTTLESASVVIEPLLNDTDVDSNVSKLRIVSISNPTYGHVLLSENLVYYAPGNSQATMDQLTYTIEDEEGAQATGTITINIIPVNEPPLAFNQTIYTNEEIPVKTLLEAIDPDGDDINYTIIYIPENGYLEGSAPDLTYTPNKDFSGNDYIAFTVNDGEYESYVGVVTIVVNPLNDPPIANAGNDYVGVRGDTVVFDGSQSYDLDGTIISYEWRMGEEMLAKSSIFEKQILEEGTYSVTLIVTDDENATDSDEKIITINPCCEGCDYPDPTETNPYN